MGSNISENMKLEIEAIADELIEAKSREIKLLEDIRYEAEEGTDKKLGRLTSKYASLSEDAFLAGKVLSVLVRTKSKPSDLDFSSMGTTENFDCTLSYENDVWEFYLPPTPSVKNGNMGKGSGRYIGYLTKNLIENYIDSHGNIKMLQSPVVVLEFGLPNYELSNLFDADNRDSKRILDAMTGTFYPDDNVIEIRTMHYGRKSNEPYTKVYVMEKEILPSWLNKNSLW